MTRVPRLTASLVALGLGLVAAGCAGNDPLAAGEPGEVDTTLTIGSQGFAESDILAYVYGLVLADHGYEVDYQLGIGAREIFIPALRDGSIDLIADYSGNLLRAADPDATASTPEDVSAALPQALEPLGLAVLDVAPAEDADALVVTAEFAERHGLTSIGDLAPIAGELTIGSNTEFETRSYGRPGLADVYGVEGWTFLPIDDFGGPATLDALRTGRIQVADIFTTNPALQDGDLVVLDDPERLIAAQNIVPLLSEALLTDDLAGVLNPVSAQLTTADLTALNAVAAGPDKPSPEHIARDWLVENDLLEH
ncbi:ABC transporter substrate-binding protein [Jiangella mangrovi]|uniref:Osmoprotectant transport system substrate-binding protein n=1 Tax=Jiangella mangrovi TaxID=1524084 RepID=A0A7W9GR85_9ACTN|nr:ABC transporter substrate-binding protein [Jiangella mangrovi]MBB5788535.1 osmoprotectant transport system substrate-binding protein [Jiangella mangrovi]